MIGSEPARPSCGHEWDETFEPGAQCLRGCGTDYDAWTAPFDVGAPGGWIHVLNRLDNLDAKLDRLLAANRGFVPHRHNPFDGRVLDVERPT
jgi:hypothetical protein